jgi:HAD superfamily hydrolase (TIGR01490 family)
MSQPKTTLAIFDFDGTLTEGHLWLGISRHHQKKRVKRRTVLLYFLTHFPYWAASKFGLYSEEKNRAKWGEDLSVLFKGFTVEDANRAFQWVTDNYFLPLMRQDVLEKLKNHQKAGHTIILLSGMFIDFLEVIGRKLGVDYVIGTRLEKNNGVYTGRIIPPLCFGENKARFLNEFYADSIYDTPILRLVGHPVATYPEEKLYTLALNKKWDILGHIDHHNSR